jgi:hypothetical protein
MDDKPDPVKNAPNCRRQGNPVEPKPAKNLPFVVSAFLGSGIVMPLPAYVVLCYYC